MMDAKLYVDKFETVDVRFDEMNVDHNEFFVYAKIYQDEETLEVLGATYDTKDFNGCLFGEKWDSSKPSVVTEATCELRCEAGIFDVPVSFSTCWVTVPREEF